MRHKITLALLLLAYCASPFFANARALKNGVYVGMEAGPSFKKVRINATSNDVALSKEDKFTASVYDAFIGYGHYVSPKRWFAAEMALGYSASYYKVRISSNPPSLLKISEGFKWAYTVMYGYKISERFYPYFGLNFAFTNYKADITNGISSTYKFAKFSFSPVLGIHRKVTGRWSAYLHGEYVFTKTIKTKGPHFSFKVKPQAILLKAGLTFAI